MSNPGDDSPSDRQIEKWLSARSAPRVPDESDEAEAEAVAQLAAELRTRWAAPSSADLADAATDDSKHAALRALHALHVARLSDDNAVEREAERALYVVARALVDPYHLRDGPEMQPSVLHGATRVEARLRAFRRRFPSWCPRRPGVWTVAGLVLSAAAAGLLASGHLALAVLIVSGRALISLTMPTPGLLGDAGAHHQLVWRTNSVGCVAGHLSDALVVGGVAGYLLRSGNTISAEFAGATAIAAIAATLLRVASLQEGLLIERLYVERIARTVPLVIGLAIGAATHGTHPSFVVPSLVLAVSGTAAYAFVEGLRTMYYRARVERLSTNNDEWFTMALATMAIPLETRLRAGSPTS